MTNRTESLRPMAYDLPRSEASTAPRPALGSESQASFQLPPIRAQPDAAQGTGGPGGPGWPRNERSGRVDIGGLLGNPEA